MNIDKNISNKIFPNKMQHYLRRIIHYGQIRLASEV